MSDTVFFSDVATLALVRIGNYGYPSDHMEQRAAVFREILKEHRADEYKLPSLSADFSFLEDLRELVLSAKEWLYSKLPFMDGRLSFEQLDWMWIFSAVMLAAGLAYVILRLCQVFRKSIPSHAARADMAAGRVRSAHQEALDHALSRGAWPQALRLRWLVFLEELARPLSTTLGGFAAGPAGRQTELPVARIYQVMFGGGAGSPDLYREFDRRLTEMSGGRSAE